MHQIGHIIELDPTQEQHRCFMNAAGAARFAYNWCLAEWQREYQAGRKPSWMQL
jgi:putative transposase